MTTPRDIVRTILWSFLTVVVIVGYGSCAYDLGKTVGNAQGRGQARTEYLEQDRARQGLENLITCGAGAEAVVVCRKLGVQ